MPNLPLKFSNSKRSALRVSSVKRSRAIAGILEFMLDKDLIIGKITEGDYDKMH